MTTTPTENIALIDLGRALDGDRTELDRLRFAGQDLGIIQVVDHGVDQALIEEFHDRIAAILALPREDKIELASPTGHPYRGWRQWPDDFGRLELERFTFGKYDSTEDARNAGLEPEYSLEYAHANVWPPQQPGLREVAKAYHAAADALARRVLGAYALALGHEPSVFPVGDGPDHSRLVVNNYPTWTWDGYDASAPDEQKLLLLEHADGNVLTVLHQRGDYNGLQGQREDGTWITVPIIPGALQVFSGGNLARWTNGALKPGRHRVVAGGSVTRLSSGMFWSPRVDTTIEPLPAFVGDGEAEFDPVVIWDGVKNDVDEYLAVFGRPEQIAAWREGRPFVATLADA